MQYCNESQIKCQVNFSLPTVWRSRVHKKSLTLVHYNYTVISHKRRRPKKNLNVLISIFFCWIFRKKNFFSFFVCCPCLYAVCRILVFVVLPIIFSDYRCIFIFILVFIFCSVVHTLCTRNVSISVSRLEWRGKWFLIEFRGKKNLTIENAFTMQFED